MSVSTATGPIEPDDLGFTLMHEHIHTASPGVRENYPFLWDRGRAMEIAVSRLKRAHDAGVRTMVEQTPADMGRDPDFVAEASRLTGVNIVMATGTYYVPSYFVYRGVDHTVRSMVHDATVGIGDSGVKVGMIKSLINHALTPEYDFSLRVAARLHLLTNLPVTVHTDGGADAARLACGVMAEEGVEPGRVVIGHAVGIDPDSLLHILDQGFVIALDQFGIEQVMPIERMIEVTDMLLQRGYSKQVVLSHDCPCYSDKIEGPTAPGLDEAANAAESEVRYGGPLWRHDTVSAHVVPSLLGRGVHQSLIDDVTVGNPARILASAS
jgi:phosphotriesterase-related protein